MVYSTQERRDVELGTHRRYGILPLLLSALVAFVLGWFGGQFAEKNNADNIPGGEPTDNISGTTPTDRR